MKWQSRLDDVTRIYTRVCDNYVTLSERRFILLTLLLQAPFRFNVPLQFHLRRQQCGQCNNQRKQRHLNTIPN